MNKVIVIVGPTGVGKTKLSIKLAKRLNGEIINADSTQIYKGLDIATAKVTEDEKCGIQHYLIDIKNMDEDYTVFDYQSDCRNSINYILSKNKTPILVGGTGLYIKAALYDYEFKQEEKKETFENLNNDELYNYLLTLDPNTDIHKNNRKRVLRSINYYLNNNVPLSEKKKSDNLLFDCVFIGLTTDRSLLYEKINDRVDSMLKNGLLSEAKKIYDMNVRSKAVMTPIGYKELFEYFDCNKTYDESVSLIKQRSRNYAKRQYTWFKNQMDISWFNVDFDNFENTVNSIYNFIKKQ